MSTICEHEARLSAGEQRFCAETAEAYENHWEKTPVPCFEGLLPPEIGGPLRTGILIELTKSDLEFRLKHGLLVNIQEHYVMPYPEVASCPSCLISLYEAVCKAFQRQGAEESLNRHLAAVPAEFRGELLRKLEPPKGYEVKEEIGRGSMGVVLRAWQTALKRYVALKMILPGPYSEPKQLNRLRREAEMIAQIQNANIVQIYEVGEHHGLPFLALEFCSGGTLEAQTAHTPQSPKKDALTIQTLARALEAAHQQQLIHRDLKPANVLLAADGTLKIADFGLAKRLGEAGQTAPGDIVGTPYYMAPEQALGLTREVGPATDVWALGAMLYELLTGNPPFRGETSLDTLSQVRTNEPVPPHRLNAKVPRDLEAIALKCLAKESRKRYASAAELADDLQRFLLGAPTRARLTSTTERAIKWARHHPVPTLVIAFAMLLPSVVAGVALWYSEQLKTQTDQAISARRDADRHKQQALNAATTLVEKVAQGVEPIAGTQSATVRDILVSARRVFAELKATDPSPEVLAGDGRMHNLFAAVFLRMNDSGRAVEEADAGLADFQQLLAEDAGNSAYRAGLADSHEVKGRASLVRDDLATALKEFTNCRDLRAGLPLEEENGAERKAALASAHVWIGVVLQAQGQTAAAKTAYTTALDLRKQVAGPVIASATPNRRRELADAHERLGNLALQYNRLDDAGEQFRQARDLLAPLAQAQGSESPTRKSLARVQLSLGNTYLLAHQRAKGVLLLKAALAASEAGRGLDPADLDWQLTRDRAQLGLALADLREGDSGIVSRLKDFQQLLDRSNALLKQDPKNRIPQAEVAAALAALAAAHYQLGAFGQAPAEHFTAAADLQAAAVRSMEDLAKYNPSNLEWTQALTKAREGLGIYEMRKAETTAPKIPNLTDPEFLQVSRSLVAQARDKFKGSPDAATAEKFAEVCLTLADLLTKGEHKPHLVEARKILQEGRDALQTASEAKGLSEPQQRLLDNVETQLKALGEKRQ